LPAAPKIDRYSPSFQRTPIQNNRTGFQPVYLPLILITPGRRTATGTGIANSDVFDVKFYIADAPDPAIVAGPEHIGLKVPSQDIFTRKIARFELANVYINLEGRRFFSPEDTNKENPHTIETAKENDLFEHTTINGNIISYIPYFPDADYYDVSKFTIDVEDLPRPKAYLFIWECKYYNRILLSESLASTRGPFCIRDDQIKLTRFTQLIHHPGDIHHELFRKTPAFYFDQGDKIKLKDHDLIRFYRPFADLLQDVSDEQTFLNGINHINKVPAQLIPYLAYLIGWDLPNFPNVTDTLRRSILRHAVYLQKLKGTKRAIIELFEIFGFSIELSNLWYSTDGKLLIAPGEDIPDNIEDEEIGIETTCQIEPLVADFNEAGFGQLEIPLLYKATGNITLNAWLVKEGIPQTQLQDIVNQISDDPEALSGQCQTSPDGFLIPQGILNVVPTNDPTIINYAEVLVGYKSGMGEGSLGNTESSINKFNITYDKLLNVVHLNFDHHLTFTNGEKLFIFATYPRTKITVPEKLDNLRSNRFDVKIILQNEIPESDFFEYLMNFIFKLKAFHSLLRKIAFDLDFLEVYNVQDYCSDQFSSVQVPPPVLPSESSEEKCEDLIALDTPNEKVTIFRQKIYDALTVEVENWKALDNTHQTTPEAEALSNIIPNKPEGEKCQFNKYGQDRVLDDDKDLDHNVDDREHLCDLIPPAPEFCFKGRVKDELIVNPPMVLPEIVRCVPCQLSIGSGEYWLYPTNAKSLLRDGFGQYPGQKRTGHLGKKIFQYDHPQPQSLHYSNRPYLSDFELDSNQVLAYQRPQLEIAKDNLNFPSHRFPSMGKLETDFVHSTWRRKPWDQDDQCADDDLGTTLLVGTDGDEYLSYSDADVVYVGNGLVPDISSLGEHEDRPFVVTHKVYMVTAPSHPAITIDENIVETNENCLIIDSNSPFGPIFRSFNQSCQKDFRSGYPAVTGRFVVDTFIDYIRDDTEDLAEQMGVPPFDIGTNPTGLFTLDSQILVTKNETDFHYYRPYRLDCECARYDCSVVDNCTTGTGITGGTGAGTGITGGTGVTGVTAGVEPDPYSFLNVDPCLFNLYKQPDGTFDFNCDQLQINYKMVLMEYFGMCSHILDGEIDNLFCLLPGPKHPPSGSIKYKDPYDIVYEAEWTTLPSSELDFTIITKSPHVWGEPDTGYIDGLRVFRRGIITTERTIFRKLEDGYEQIFITRDQAIGFFQVNTICGERPFIDNFCYHLNCEISDKISLDVICGSRWVSPDDIQVEWPVLFTNSSSVVTGYQITPGIQPFLWVNIWDNDDDLIHICPSEGTGTGTDIEELINALLLEGGDFLITEDGKIIILE
jgi:hypothetical protein